MTGADQKPLGTAPADAPSHPQLLSKFPTGAKVFLILVASLLPLAVIAMLTNLRTTGFADAEAQARLSAAAQESSSALATTLANHVAELREGLGALERNPEDAPSCTRVAGALAAYSDTGTRFSIVDANGTVLCGRRLNLSSFAQPRTGEVRPTVTGDGLALRVGGASGTSATVFYPAVALAQLARPSGFVPDYGSALVLDDGERLTLRALSKDNRVVRHETARTELGIEGLYLQMTMPGAPITGPLLVATALLIMMWLAAAAIGWFVVDRLLIRPLRRLRRIVRDYQPGEVIDPTIYGHFPAAEIRELGDTFRDISRTVQAHEADLAEGLVRQTRLTREVHHRVKNNLQVIASLINFHARGARSVEATEAYASIQRRVDALAVVHRHHYAEMEETRGLELRSVIGELASNIRATAPDRTATLGITLEVEPFLVTQDTAVAVSFLLTEIIELAMSCNSSAQIRISMKGLPEGNRATLRVVSPALIDSPQLATLLENRYSRVMTGLARQLRTQLHHDPLSGAYETSIAVTGKP